jgi:hypothetical protein
MSKEAYEQGLHPQGRTGEDYVNQALSNADD